MFPYSRKQLSDALNHPRLIMREVRQLLSSPFKTYTCNTEPRDGCDVMAQDWDNLIILDACRWDYFQELNPFDTKALPTISRASTSFEFMEANWVDNTYHDTVYITANTHVEFLDDDIFHSIDPLLNQWNKESGTILPECVVEAALSAHGKYPNKRLITHFMQPHQPYLGPTAEACKDRIDLRGMRKYYDRRIEQEGINWWRAVHKGLISQEELQQAYYETLEIVLEHVQQLVAELDGKTVITADHGELLGERLVPFGPRLYGHSHNIYPDQLVLVPWLALPFEQRRSISTDPPENHERLDDATVEKRLTALGYT